MLRLGAGGHIHRKMGGGCSEFKAACEYQGLLQSCSFLGAKQRTPSPSLVAFYDTPGKVWPASIFFVALLAREIRASIMTISEKFSLKKHNN